MTHPEPETEPDVLFAEVEVAQDAEAVEDADLGGPEDPPGRPEPDAAPGAH